MSKLKEALFKRKLNTVELAKLTGIDRVLISFVANDKALFTPKDTLKVSEVLETKPSKIWNKKEMYIKEVEFSPYKPKTEDVRTVYRQVHFRAVTECYSSLLTKDKLQFCGYKSLQDWGMHCMQNLKRQYDRKLKKQKEQQNDNSRG